jgi:hypothetical protein
VISTCPAITDPVGFTAVIPRKFPARLTPTYMALDGTALEVAELAWSCVSSGVGRCACRMPAVNIMIDSVLNRFISTKITHYASK